VLHLAAVVGGRAKIEGDPLAVATDLSIDADFFNWLARTVRPDNIYDPKRIVYFSSSAVYPKLFQSDLGSRPLNEDMILWNNQSLLGSPDMTYGWAKLTGEYLAHFAVNQYQLPVVIYRPFSGYGPGQSFDYPFPSIVKRVMDGGNVTIWGTGEQRRDFIHINDVVEAVFATMHKLVPGEALNLGSGVGTSFNELALRAAKVLGRTIKLVSELGRPVGVMNRVADASRFLEMYQPHVDLDAGIFDVAQHLTSGAEL
jgi:GDP-L-fucose synthase